MKKYTPISLVLFLLSASCFAVDLFQVRDTIEYRQTESYKIKEQPKKLVKAIIKGNLSQVKLLIDEGYNINNTDSLGWTPLDYAKKMNRPEIVTFLSSIGAKTFTKRLPNMKEGPHIRVSDSSTVEVLYLTHDSLNNKTSTQQNRYSKAVFPQRVNGIPIDLEDLTDKAKRSYPKGIYSGVEKILVIGDVHGEHDRVYKLLKNNGIIDYNGNWSWGNGHLVFIGDIFDRGSKVTEMLWLIFKLEKQAIKSGGKVHLLLGNHEPMIFKNDLRYVADNYYALCENLGLSYSKLFDEKSALGLWLRQKPVILRINDYVFVHAGISPKLFEMKMEIDSINSLVWQFLNNWEDRRNTEVRSFILSSKGILWYRGYTPNEDRKDVIDERIIENELAFYRAKTFIVGHTEVDSISTFFNGKVINVNIPKADKRVREQALLIQGKHLFIVYSDSKRKELF